VFAVCQKEISGCPIALILANAGLTSRPDPRESGMKDPISIDRMLCKQRSRLQAAKESKNAIACV
jgi:hypothetical protein